MNNGRRLCETKKMARKKSYDALRMWSGFTSVTIDKGVVFDIEDAAIFIYGPVLCPNSWENCRSNVTLFEFQTFCFLINLINYLSFT